MWKTTGVQIGEIICSSFLNSWGWYGTRPSSVCALHYCALSHYSQTQFWKSSCYLPGSLINSSTTLRNIDFRNFVASECRLVRKLQKSTVVRRLWLRRQFDLVKYSSAIYIAKWCQAFLCFGSLICKIGIKISVLYL